MKFICTQENLLTGLVQVTPLAGRNNQLVILNHVLLETKDGVLHLSCTDLENGVHTTVAGKIEQEGTCAVPAKKLLEYIQQIPSTNPLTIELKKNRLSIETQGFKAQFPTTPADDFPLLPSMEAPREVSVPAAAFCQALSATAFAASREEIRPEIHSVYIHGEGNQLRLAATDSFRLAEEVITLAGEIDEFSVLLPLTTAQEVIRLFSEAETLTLLPQESHIAFVGDGLHLSSRLVAGQFPDYRQIIPQQYTLTGEVDSAELRRALKTAAVFLPKDTRRVQMVLTPSEETLVLKVIGNETGEGEVTIPFQGKGDPIEVLFNVHYVLEGATRLGTPKCQLQLVSGGDPVLFRPVGGERQYLYVVMPIQL